MATTTGTGLEWPLKRVRPLHVMAGLTAAGAVVRFATLGTQSYWYDETTTVQLVRMSFGGMLHGIRAHETTPPLYFGLAWVWSRVFGTGEVGLRSLSAVLGTLLVPVAYASGRTLVGRRAGVAAAALAAASPALVWYSQEARSYALLTLLSGLSLLFFARSRERPLRRNLAGWALTSALAVGTHYFALFLVVPEAVWLLATLPRNRRDVALASALVAAVCLALAPLALYQREHGGGGWISALPFFERLRHVPYFFATALLGQISQRERAALIATGAVFALALWYLLRRADGRTRNGALVALGVGASAIAIPLALKLVGSDYVLDRNLLPAWLPLAIVVAAGLGARQAGGIGIGVLAAICAVFVLIDVEISTSSDLQRDDWRTVARQLGARRHDRVIAVAPAWQSSTLTLYLSGLEEMSSPRPVREVDTVVYGGFVPGTSHVSVTPPGFGFTQISRSKIQRITIIRARAEHPILLGPDALNQPGSTPSAVFIQSGR